MTRTSHPAGGDLPRSRSATTSAPPVAKVPKTKNLVWRRDLMRWRAMGRARSAGENVGGVKERCVQSRRSRADSRAVEDVEGVGGIGGGREVSRGEERRRTQRCGRLRAAASRPAGRRTGRCTQTSRRLRCRRRRPRRRGSTRRIAERFADAGAMQY